VIALIVVGEQNFWSAPLAYQTEPIASVGQWWSIGASVLAACGSLYLLLAEYLGRAEKGTTTAYPTGHCVCQCHSHGTSSHHGSPNDSRVTVEVPRPPEQARMSEADRHGTRRETLEYHPALTPTDTYPDTEGLGHGLGIRPIDSSSSATGMLKKIAGLGTPSESDDRYNVYAFRQGKVTSFPTIPGEDQRNPHLAVVQQQWVELPTEDDDSHTPRGRRSRANSFHGSRSNSIGPRAHSPQPQMPTQPSRPGLSILGLPASASPETTSESIFPSQASAELEKTKSQGTVVTLHQGVGAGSPDIVLSSEDEPSDACPLDGAGAPKPPIEAMPPRLREQ
jgi:hypothetical protein